MAQPAGSLPKSTWFFGLGVILVAGNIARYLFGVGISRCSGFWGVIMVVAGGMAFWEGIPLIPGSSDTGRDRDFVRIVTGKTCCPNKGSNTDSGCCEAEEEQKSANEDPE